MKLLIVEDETAAARQMQQLVLSLMPDCRITAILESVADTVAWLNSNEAPDLVLMDIQLSDGISFDIFKQTTLTAPVIFTTAYDEYALQAFKVNSIDYLLKPIDRSELESAFAKYHTHYTTTGAGEADLLHRKIDRLLQQIPVTGTGNWKKRLLVKTHEGFESIYTEDVLFFRAQGKQAYAHTIDGGEYAIDDTLDDLEKTLSPSRFFRLNRQYIACSDSIDKIITHFNGKLKLRLRKCADDDIFVSREKAALFKQWLNE